MTSSQIETVRENHRPEPGSLETSPVANVVPPPDRPSARDRDVPAISPRASFMESGPLSRTEPPHVPGRIDSTLPREETEVYRHAEPAPRFPPAAPIAAFDMRRTHAPDLPPRSAQASVPRESAAPGAAMGRSTSPVGRAHRALAIDTNAPAHGWPDLPPWPLPSVPPGRTHDPHAADRRRRLEREQRG